MPVSGDSDKRGDQADNGRCTSQLTAKDPTAAKEQNWRGGAGTPTEGNMSSACKQVAALQSLYLSLHDSTKCPPGPCIWPSTPAPSPRGSLWTSCPLSLHRTKPLQPSQPRRGWQSPRSLTPGSMRELTASPPELWRETVLKSGQKAF